MATSCMVRAFKYNKGEYIMSLKNDTDVTHYNFTIHRPIFVIFGIDVTEIACYQMVVCYPPLLTDGSAIPEET